MVLNYWMQHKMQPVEIHLSGKYLVQDIVAGHPFGRRHSASNIMLAAQFPKKIPVSIRKNSPRKKPDLNLTTSFADHLGTCGNGEELG